MLAVQRTKTSLLNCVSIFLDGNIIVHLNLEVISSNSEEPKHIGPKITMQYNKTIKELAS